MLSCGFAQHNTCFSLDGNQKSGLRDFPGAVSAKLGWGPFRREDAMDRRTCCSMLTLSAMSRKFTSASEFSDFAYDCCFSSSANQHGTPKHIPPKKKEVVFLGSNLRAPRKRAAAPTPTAALIAGSACPGTGWRRLPSSSTRGLFGGPKFVCHWGRRFLFPVFGFLEINNPCMSEISGVWNSRNCRWNEASSLLPACFVVCVAPGYPQPKISTLQKPQRK